MHKVGLRGLAAVIVMVTGSTLALTTPSSAEPLSTTGVGTSSEAAGSAEPLGAQAVDIAHKHVAKRAGTYGLSSADVSDLEVSSVVPSKSSGLTNVYLQQRVNSIEVSTAMLNVAVTAKGKVLRVASSAVASAGKKANGATPKISDVQAAQRGRGSPGPGAQRLVRAATTTQTEPSRARTLREAGISQDPITARLVYQETKKGDLRLAWELVINQLDGEHWWQIRMDAATGDELDKTDWVDEDSHRVFPFPTEAPSFGGRSLVSNPATSASPFGWNDTNGAAGAESTLTIGNNVSAYTDIDNDNMPDAGSSPDGGAGLVFDFPLDLTQAPSTYRPAAVSNLFYANNRIHDVLYRYGFNEAAGNFQVNNYGNGGVGNDAVNAEAQDGGGINNANFATPPDGSRPRMQMYLWNLSTPERDGDFDNGIIVHEYGHGVSNRLTGGPSTTSCLSNQEQGGEGWSDYLAYMLTMPTGTEPAGGRGIGTYALNQPTNGLGIRTQKYSTNMAINDHTYDAIKTMAVPHGVGEVWATMLWDLTYDLIDEYGFNANLITGTRGQQQVAAAGHGRHEAPAVQPRVRRRPRRDPRRRRRQLRRRQPVPDLGRLRPAWPRASAPVQGSSASRTDGTEAFDLPASCNGVALTTTATPSPVPAGQQLTYDLHLENTSRRAGERGQRDQRAR